MAFWDHRLALGLYAVICVAAAIASPVSAEPRLKVSWKMVSYLPGRGQERGATESVFTVTNLGPAPLPASGWALYFSSISAARTSRNHAQDQVDHVAGPLFRVRAPADQAAVGPGQSLSLHVEHSDILVKNEKGPQAPYIVFDDAPDRGLPVESFVSTPLPRLAQLEGVTAPVSTLVSPQTIYQRNQAVADLPEGAYSPILPKARSVIPAQGGLILSAASHVTGPRALAAEARFARQLLSTLAGASGPGGAKVRLSLAPIGGLTSPEAYELKVAPDHGVTITGASPAGVYYGLQTLRQLIAPGQTGPATLSAVEIRDAPRFAYRGLMLDVARNFHGKTEVLRILDLMARYKLNRLHLHLCDDEGWRLQIKALPELTQVGARRGHTVTGLDHLPPAYGSGPDVDDPHGSGFFSQTDYIEIIRYAHRRHIEVVPEIEMPGHARAAVKAMEARYQAELKRGAARPDRFRLVDPDDRSSYRSAQYYTDNVINPGLDSSYRFIDTVLAEVAQMHQKAGAPLRVIHVGADELPLGAWEQSPAVKRAIARIGGQTTADLWDHFYDRVAVMARRHGAHLAGWEELGVRKTIVAGRARPAPNPHFLGQGLTLHVWNNLKGSEDLANRLANAGYDVVLSSATRLYFDMAYSIDSAEPGHNWAGHSDLSDVFDFDPLRTVAQTPSNALSSLSSAGGPHIIGLEGTLFGETLREPERLSYMMAPRLLALAERAWAPTPDWADDIDSARASALHAQDWSRFVNILGKREAPRLDLEAPWLSYRLPSPGLSLTDDAVVANIEYPGLILRYTTDGAPPTATSPRVAGPIRDKGRITVSAFSRNGRAGRSSSIDNP